MTTVKQTVTAGYHGLILVNSEVPILFASLIDGSGERIDSNKVKKIWVVRDIPTLSQWGLIAMASILGIVGFMVMRRRKVTV